jgi:hypothetical protein
MGVAKTCISEICEKEHELKAFGMLNGMWGLGKLLQVEKNLTKEELCKYMLNENIFSVYQMFSIIKHAILYYSYFL